ncbi:MAG: hypothetical protein H6578_00565 [Chitinophagales bacterium]|nr:hypothetical protein [Chitinophagales bacterium]
MRYFWVLILLFSCNLRNNHVKNNNCSTEDRQQITKKYCFSCHGLRKNMTAVKLEYLIDSVGIERVILAINDTIKNSPHSNMNLSDEEIRCITEFLSDSPWIVVDY